MPRKQREWFPGAAYHIMCRGNHRSEIYRDDDDRQVYLAVLKETLEKYPFYLLSYCLMSNHVHLHIETIDIDPGKIMKHLNMKYAIFFNNKYNFVGHLFQGRYRSETIETDSHNLQTSKYIHLNPVRANMAERPLDYLWSSYREYLGQNKTGMVAKEKILGHFKTSSSRLYQQYVEREIEYISTPANLATPATPAKQEDQEDK